MAVCNDSERIKVNSAIAKNAKKDEKTLSQRRVEFTKDQCLIIFLNMLHNDLICLELCRKAEKFLTINYSNINSSFADIAKFIGSKEPQETMLNIIKNPFLKKLSPIDLNMVSHLDFCRTISDVLTNTLLTEIELLKEGEQSKRPITFVLNTDQILAKLSPELTAKLL